MVLAARSSAHSAEMAAAHSVARAAKDIFVQPLLKLAAEKYRALHDKHREDAKVEQNRIRQLKIAHKGVMEQMQCPRSLWAVAECRSQL